LQTGEEDVFTTMRSSQENPESKLTQNTNLLGKEMREEQPKGE
jgi:hypothetical protein